jgi:hypothetical protein
LKAVAEWATAQSHDGGRIVTTLGSAESGIPRRQCHDLEKIENLKPLKELN